MWIVSPQEGQRLGLAAVTSVMRAQQIPLARIGERLQVHPASVTGLVAVLAELRQAAGRF